MKTVSKYAYQLVEGDVIFDGVVVKAVTTKYQGGMKWYQVWLKEGGFILIKPHETIEVYQGR